MYPFGHNVSEINSTVTTKGDDVVVEANKRWWNCCVRGTPIFLEIVESIL